MGWKLFSIIVSPAPDISDEDLLTKLGLPSFKKIQDEPYAAAIYPNDSAIYIGRCNNSLILSNLDLPPLFYTKDLSDVEKKFIAIAPESEIAAYTLHSVVNYWGYAIIKNGKKIRVKAGDADNGVEIDIGEPLEQELNLLSSSKVDADGQRQYYFEGEDEEPYTEDQVGENFVFELFTRYFDAPLDQCDDLFDLVCQGYSAQTKNATRPQNKEQSNTRTETSPSAKAWWKFW